MKRMCLLLMLVFAKTGWSAPNLVNNPGFENFFAGWVRPIGWGADAPPHSGNIGIFSLGPSDFGNALTQLVQGLTVGQIYDVSFWTRNSQIIRNPPPGYVGVQVIFAGTVFTAFDTGEVYQQFQFTAPATATSETLSVGGINPDFSVFFDDFSVSEAAAAAPELSGPQGFTAGLFILSTLALLLERRGQGHSVATLSLGNVEGFVGHPSQIHLVERVAGVAGQADRGGDLNGLGGKSQLKSLADAFA